MVREKQQRKRIMDYTTEVVIDRPVEHVIALFEDPNMASEWQPGLVSITQASGEPGQPGAKATMRYKDGNRTMDLTETILTNNLPEEFTATYEAPGVLNTQRNHFHAEGKRTRWVAHSTFTFKGLMAIMGLLMPGRFRKQTREDMERFKAFAERA
jgi:uncharacterized membrane protein